MDWSKKSIDERLAELGRLNAEHFGYDVNNPPRMERRLTRILHREDNKFIVIDVDKKGRRKKRFVTEEKWRNMW